VNYGDDMVGAKLVEIGLVAGIAAGYTNPAGSHCFKAVSLYCSGGEPATTVICRRTGGPSWSSFATLADPPCLSNMRLLRRPTLT
jgi:hypothetical protein